MYSNAFYGITVSAKLNNGDWVQKVTNAETLLMKETKGVWTDYNGENNEQWEYGHPTIRLHIGENIVNFSMDHLEIREPKDLVGINRAVFKEDKKLVELKVLVKGAWDSENTNIPLWENGSSVRDNYWDFMYRYIYTDGTCSMYNLSPNIFEPEEGKTVKAFEVTANPGRGYRGTCIRNF